MAQTTEFDLLDAPLLWIPVIWPGLIQREEGAVAEVTEHRVEVQVEILDREAFGKWLVEIGRDAEDGSVDAAAELANVKAVVRNWRKVRAGKSVFAFNDDNLSKLINVPNFVTAFGAAYMNAWRGRAETREGNSAA